MDIKLEVVNDEHIRLDGADYYYADVSDYIIFIPENQDDFSHEIITSYKNPLSSEYRIQKDQVRKTSWGEIAFINGNCSIDLHCSKIPRKLDSDPMVFCTKRVGEVLVQFDNYTEILHSYHGTNINLFRRKCREKGLDINTYKYFSKIPKDGIIVKSGIGINFFDSVNFTVLCKHNKVLFGSNTVDSEVFRILSDM